MLFDIRGVAAVNLRHRCAVRSPFQPVIAAVEIRQRPSARYAAKPSRPNHDRMIATRDNLRHLAFDEGNHAIQNGNTRFPHPVFDGPKPVVAGSREMIRQIPLVRTQIVNTKRTARSNRANVLARLSMQQRNWGGSSDKEVTALIVIPCGSPSADIDVTTDTPVSQWLAICLKRSGVTNGQSNKPRILRTAT